MTQQVTANAEESALASGELSGQTLQLKEMLFKFKLRKRGLNLAAAGLPEDLTPEMIEMLKRMIQSQKLVAAAASSASGKSATGGQSGKAAAGARGTRPSSVIALDDSEFGNF
jgi:methyl-accepting chemotaxis protein